MLKNTTFFVLLTVMIAAITGCASNDNYTTGLKECKYNKAGDCSKAATQHYRDGTDQEHHLRSGSDTIDPVTYRAFRKLL